MSALPYSKQRNFASAPHCPTISSWSRSLTARNVLLYSCCGRIGTSPYCRASPLVSKYKHRARRTRRLNQDRIAYLGHSIAEATGLHPDMVTLSVDMKDGLLSLRYGSKKGHVRVDRVPGTKKLTLVGLPNLPTLY